MSADPLKIPSGLSKPEFSLHEALRYLWAGILVLVAWKVCSPGA